MAIDQSAYSFTTVTLPGVAVVPQLADINNRGDIVGHYDDPSGEHGFLLRGGQLTTLDVPGAQGTVATGVDDAGDIVGTYLDAAGTALHGFLWQAGAFTTLDIPGAGSTDLNGINNRGQIVAFATAKEAGQASGGFLFEDGAFAPITVPGQPDAFLGPQGINDEGVIVGVSGNQGFVLESGELTLIDNPFSSFQIRPNDVNAAGQVVGSVVPAQRTGAGFVLEGGEITLFGPPVPPGQPPGWNLSGINDAGEIVGNSVNNGGSAFLATPTPAPPPDGGGSVDWDALAAQVQANFAATGQWFVGDEVPPPPDGSPDWDALAARVQANFAATGHWFA
jgi:uncharacterized membrane protein